MVKAPPETSVRPSKSWKTASRCGHPWPEYGDVHDPTEVQKNFRQIKFSLIFLLQSHALGSQTNSPKIIIWMRFQQLVQVPDSCQREVGRGSCILLARVRVSAILGYFWIWGAGLGLCSSLGYFLWPCCLLAVQMGLGGLASSPARTTQNMDQ